MPEKILVVDDEPGIVQLCLRILGQQGYNVHGATGGQEAIARLQSESFDLLLVDIKMPEVDGLTVLRQGREIWPDLAAVVITGFATLSSAVEALHAGVHRFVLKPFNSAELVQAVQETLAARQKEQDRLLLRAQLPILEIAQALLIEGDLELLTQQILQPVVQELAVEQGAILAFETETDTLQMIGSIGQVAFPIGTCVSVSTAFLEQLRQRSDPIVLDPQPWMDEFLPAERHGNLGMVACVPLRTVKQLVGALCLGRVKGAAPFTPSELGLFTIIGGQIATVVENARLYEVVARGKSEWEATFDAIADGISIHDAGFLVLRANRALAEKLGLPLRDLIGRRCSELFHGTADPPAFCLAARALETGQPQTFECDLPSRGSIFQCTVYPLDQEEGGKKRFVHVLRDITAQKRAEALTGAQRDLDLAPAAAHEIDRLRSRLAANLSRELRVPLERIKSLSSTLLRPDAGLAEATRREFLESIADEAERLERIVGDPPDLS